MNYYVSKLLIMNYSLKTFDSTINLDYKITNLDKNQSIFIATDYRLIFEGKNYN